MRKLFLILCLAFGILAFGYPCLVLPIGTYKMETKITTVSYSFKFDGKVDVISSLKLTEDGDAVETKSTKYYKLDWKRGVIISDNDKFDGKVETLIISNIFSVNGMDNPIALAISIGVAVVDLVLVLTIRKKRA